jgi:hypothetical protein
MRKNLFVLAVLAALAGGVEPAGAGGPTIDPIVNGRGATMQGLVGPAPGADDNGSGMSGALRRLARRGGHDAERPAAGRDAGAALAVGNEHPHFE